VDRDLWIKVGREKLDAAKKERDEARAEVEERKEALLEAATRINELRTKREHWFKKAKQENEQWLEARAEVERLQRANANTLADLAVAIEQRDEAFKNQKPTPIVQQVTTRQEPSRLEIAAMLLAALAGRESESWEAKVEAIWAVEQADELIAAEKETK
jgi:hypothetical protein